MRHRVVGLCASLLLAGAIAGPASAARPVKLADRFLFLAPDTRLGLVVIMNIDRATYCTPAIVGWEEAFIDWLDGGQVGDPPEFPGAPAGFDRIRIQDKVTGKGALVHHVRGSRLRIELWQMDAGAPLVGPCTDTDDAMHRIGTGTATFSNNDNDLFGSGTRGNAFWSSGLAFLTDEAGHALKYSFRFHLDSRCHATATGEPACLIDRSTLRVH